MKTSPPPKPIKPFLKWPGGKFRVLGTLQKHLPTGKRLLEPFVGAGSVFLNSDYPTYAVNDLNPDLIRLYELLKTEGSAFITQAKAYFKPRYNEASQYYRLRDRFNKTRDPRLFLYLNRHGFNGLCRYNKQGKFNVPFGRYKKPYFPQKELEHFIERAQHTEFFCLPFEDFLKQAQRGDVIYCDPPYAPLTTTADFNNYTGVGFGVSEQEKLAEQANQLARKKIPTIISNHDVKLTRKLYEGAKLHSLNVTRTISCVGAKRKAVKELIAVF